MSTMVDALRERLVEVVGDPGRVSVGESDLDLHAADLSYHAPRRPAVVVYPVTTGEVSAILALADRERVPVTPFGAGSSIEGHVIPAEGAISLDLTRMDAIEAIRPDDLVAVVRPGVTRSALERAAAPHGLWFPIDPGADATLGGMAATNAAGTTTVRFGKMRANILALEAVLPGGRVIRTGSASPKTSAGYDLTGLLVGSEGTLAVITELTLRLHGLPEHTVAARISFPDLESACRVAAAAVAAGTGVQRLELLDARTVANANAYLELSYPETPCLFVEAAGSRSSVEDDLELVLELAKTEGAIEVAFEREAEARTRLWKARHTAAYAASALAPGRGHRSTDTCVPLSELAAAATLAREELDRLGLDGTIIGHAGDGNLHVGVMVDPNDEAELVAAETLAGRLVEDALARGGTCTGEHGIGIGKLAALELEHPDLIPLYRGIKDVFDPHGIMNPGKVLRAA